MQRNITSSAFAPMKSARLTVFPETVSGSEKSGATVPSGNMVEGVKAMREIWEASPGVSTDAEEMTKREGQNPKAELREVEDSSFWILAF